MTINLMKPPFIVDAGPRPGVYASAEAYENHLKHSGIEHPLNMNPLNRMRDEMKLSTGCFTGDPELDEKLHKGEEVTPPEVTEIKPIECTPKTWDEVDQLFEELKQRCRDGGGEGLRAELTSTLAGARLVVVFDWEDM